MADTYSPFGKVRLIEPGTADNSWGSSLNTDVFTLIDHGVWGEATIALGTSTSYNIAALSNGVASEARYLCLLFTGTPASAVTVTVPASVLKKLYLIRNSCGQTITLGYATGASVTIASGAAKIVYCTGTTVIDITAIATDAAQLGGVDASLYARLNNPQNFTAGQGVTPVVLTDGATITPNAADSDKFYVTLGGNRTLANPINPRNGQTMEVLVRQDSSGSRTLTYGSQWRWSGGVNPTLTTTANRADLIIASYYSNFACWIASIVQDFNVA